MRRKKEVLAEAASESISAPAALRCCDDCPLSRAAAATRVTRLALGCRSPLHKWVTPNFSALFHHGVGQFPNVANTPDQESRPSSVRRFAQS